MGLKAGFWTGMRRHQEEAFKYRDEQERIDKEESRYQQQRQDLLDSQELTRLTALKGAIFPQVKSVFDSKKAQREAITSSLSSLRALDIPKDVALGIIKSGQANIVLEAAAKNGGVLRNTFYAQLQDRINERFGAELSVDDRVELILNGTSLAANDPTDAGQLLAMTTAIMGAENEEQMFKRMEDFDLGIGTPFAGSADPYEINFASMTQTDASVQKTIDTLTKKSLDTVFGGGITVTELADGSVRTTFEANTDLLYGKDGTIEIMDAASRAVVRLEQGYGDIVGNKDLVVGQVRQMVQNIFSKSDILKYLNQGVGIVKRERYLFPLPTVQSSPEGSPGNQVPTPNINLPGFNPNLPFTPAAN